MVPRVTMRELLAAISEYAESDVEIVATATHMVNSGRVRLRGAFAGARVVLPPALDRDGARTVAVA
jgi:hypothetical protein